MLKKPKFKDLFQVELLESDHVFLLREDSYTVLPGAKYKQLAALLDGTRSIVDLTFELNGQISMPVIQYMIGQLEKQGCLTEGANENGTSPESAYLFGLGVDAPETKPRIAQTRVAVQGTDKELTEPLSLALEAQGVQVVTDEDESDLRVVVVADYLSSDLDAINREAIASGQPWLLVKLAGLKSWIGPLFQPTATACWECLAQRLRTNRQLEAFLGQRRGTPDPVTTPQGALPTTIATAANMVAVEVVKWVAKGKNERLKNRILMFDHLKLAIEEHTVVQRLQCPVCGDAAYESTPRTLAVTSDDEQPLRSGMRLQSSDALYERLRHHISPVTGVIKSLVDVGREADGLIYNAVAEHYFPLLQNSVMGLRQNLLSHTGGKGTTKAQARMSAMGEAIERYATCYWGGEASEQGSYESLKERAVHPQTVLGLSDYQFENREQWNRENAGGYQLVPNRFREELEIAWTPIWSLTNQEFKLLPATLCYYGHPDSRYFFNVIDSNGVAAGSTRVEAALQGFGELVERDSVALWWYNRVQRPGVVLESFELPYLAQLQAHYRQLNRDYWVLDITSDLGIPAFAALSRRTDKAAEDIIYGFGANLDPKLAIMQAVTEMNQCLPAVSSTNADGSTYYQWPRLDAHEWWKNSTITNQPYLMPHPDLPAKTLADFPVLSQPTLKANLDVCVDIMRKAGLEMFILDLTRPDIEMSVCRVIVPGMRHFWRRLGPGRLYDIPVALGWLEAPRQEADLNPYSIFF
jgi:bacteriocin biosynthesis cyclodehydratase domain-containing protein